MKREKASAFAYIVRGHAECVIYMIASIGKEVKYSMLIVFFVDIITCGSGPLRCMAVTSLNL